jgi:outer membrane protein TolC
MGNQGIAVRRKDHGGPSRPRIGIALPLILLLASGCAGRSKEQLAHVGVLKERVAQLDAPAPADRVGVVALPELIARAKQRSPEALRAELRAVVDQADFDQNASAGLPRIGIEADYGRSAYLRRDENGGLRVAPALNWDVMRLLQTRRMRRLRVSSDRAGALGEQIALEDVELEVVRRFAEREAARAMAPLAAQRAEAAARQARIAQIQGDTAADASTLEANAAAAERQRVAADGRLELADARLRSFCGLGPKETIAGDYPRETSEPPPLGDYLQLVLANAEGIELARVRTALADERARAAAAQRWSMFRFSSDAGDVLRLLSSSPFALLQWSYALIDQGDFNRQLVKARAEALLARLDRADEADRLLEVAGRVWVGLLDSAVERRKAVDAERVSDLAQRVAAAQVGDRVAAPETLGAADLALASARTDLKLRSLDQLVLATQFRLLGGEPRT